MRTELMDAARRGFRGRVIAAALTAAVGVLVNPQPGVAWAQAEGTARFVVPLADGTQLRCGSGVAWYPVATLNTSVVLKAVDESDGWIRVEYPAGTPIVVKSEEGEVRDGKVILTRRSRLRAYNPGSPVLEECYKAVFDQFLLPGVEMPYRGQVKNREGAVAGLLVEAPAGATGFVLSREVRPASEAEARGVAAALPTSSTPAATPPEANPVADASVHEPAPEVAPPPDAAPVAQASEEAGNTPAIEPASVETVAANPIESKPAVPAEEARPGAPSLRDLDAAFEKIMREPLDASDPAELIEQYRAYQSANADEQSVARSGLYLSTRLDALELRSKARALSLALANVDQALEKASESIGQTIARLSKGREYQVVGRLLPSTVYDGKRLPLMYRLVSIDSSSSRTLAYVAPEASLELDNKVGAIVGVLGESSLEPSQMVSVIHPASVDVLQATPRNE